MPVLGPAELLLVKLWIKHITIALNHCFHFSYRPVFADSGLSAVDRKLSTRTFRGDDKFFGMVWLDNDPMQPGIHMYFANTPG